MPTKLSSPIRTPIHICDAITIMNSDHSFTWLMHLMINDCRLLTEFSQQPRVLAEGSDVSGSRRKVSKSKRTKRWKAGRAIICNDVLVHNFWKKKSLANDSWEAVALACSYECNKCVVAIFRSLRLSFQPFRQPPSPPPIHPSFTQTNHRHHPCLLASSHPQHQSAHAAQSPSTAYVSPSHFSHESVFLSLSWCHV